MQQNTRISLICGAFVATSFLAGCGDDAGNKAVRTEVEKSGATNASGASAYGKVSNETKLPPQGKPPAPGTDFSQRGKAASAAGSAPAP